MINLENVSKIDLELTGGLSAVVSKAELNAITVKNKATTASAADLNRNNGLDAALTTAGKTTAEYIDKIVDLTGINSSASEIDAISNSKFREVQSLLRTASYGNINDAVYIVSGDSTRNNSLNKMISYYGEQLAKVNISLINNALGGQTASDWLNNVDRPNLNDAISSSTGVDGENTILEFSYGINDYIADGMKETVKATIRNCLTSFLQAKPKAKVILCIPVATSYTLRNTDLFDIYTELAQEFNLPLIDTYTEVTLPIQGTGIYYTDSVHPNSFGSRRIVNYILNDILPNDLLQVVTLEEKKASTATDSELNYSPFLLTGIYNATGAIAGNANTRRTPIIDVEPNFTLLITTTTTYGVAFFDVNNIFISYLSTISYGGGKRYVVVPAGAYKVGFNVSLDGVTYDATGNIPSVKYEANTESYMRISKINENLNIKNTIKVDTALDYQGTYGSIGQVQVSQGDGRWLWKTLA